MGTGYTRNDTANNIADGNVINAADFDGEYDAIEAAFNSSTGHTHDGTAAEGGPITVLGPSQEFVASASAVAPSTNAGLDLGTTSLKFKDLYIDGTAYIDGLGGNLLIDTTNALQFRDTALSISSSADGQLDIAADTTAKITSPEVIVTDDFRLQSDAAILTFGADDDVTVTHVADTGLDVQAASGFTLKLQTGDTTVESGNTIGKISFNAPDEASGTDAILVGAEIEAAAEDTFSSTVNSTALVFKTNTSAAATERMRIKSDGDIVFTGASANMTWDTSADSLDFADGGQVALGSDDDLVITHSGTAGSITNATGDLTVDVAGDIILDADGADIVFKDDGTQIGKITNASNNLEIHSSVSDADIVFKGNDGGVTVTALTLDMSEGGKAIFASGTQTEFSGQTIISTNDNDPQLILKSTDPDGADGPILDLVRDSASPADNDFVGSIRFRANDDGGTETQYADIRVITNDITNGTEDGQFNLRTLVNGTLRLRMKADPTEIVFNEESQDLDFRVESDGNENAFFVDASTNNVGIGTNSPSHPSGTGITVYNDSTPRIAFKNSTTGTTSTDGGEIFMSGNTMFIQNREDNAISMSTNATTRFTLGNSSGSAVFNDGSYDYDFRVESDNNANMLFVDASTDRVGIGTSSPATAMLHVANDPDSASWHDNNTIIYTLDPSIQETQQRQMFTIEAGSTRTSCHARITFIPRSTGGIGAMYGGYMDVSINRADSGVAVVVERIQNASGGSGSVSMMTPTVSGNVVTFGMYAGNNGTSSTYSVETRIEITSHSPTNWAVSDVSSTNTTHTGTPLRGGWYIGGNTGQNTMSYRYNDVAETVINDSSEDVDFRVESNNNAYMLFLDASQERIGIGTSTAVEGSTNVYFPLVVQANSTADAIAIKGRSADDIGELSFYENDASTQLGNVQARPDSLRLRALSNSSNMLFETTDSSALLQTRMTLKEAEAVINDVGTNTDFRVESDNVSDVLFVDAGNDRIGVATSSPSYNVDIQGATTAGSQHGTIVDGICARINGTNSNTSDAFLQIGNERYSVYGPTDAGIVFRPSSSNNNYYPGVLQTCHRSNNATSTGVMRWYNLRNDSPQEIGLYEMNQSQFAPLRDNVSDLGGGSYRFDDVYATNATIQTSDRNEKQDIEDLSEAELRVATAAKGLIKKYRWIDAVQRKGDDARIHVGIIAQDLQAAFEAEGLNADDYAMFIRQRWWSYTDAKGQEEKTDDAEEAAQHESSVEHTRLGVRYSELLAFIIAAM